MKKGELLCATYGEYSDYRILGIFRALHNIEECDLVRAFVPHEPERTRNGKIPTDNFLKWAVAEGYLEEVESTEFFIGSYGELDEHAVCEHKRARSARLDKGSLDGREMHKVSGYFCPDCTATSETGDFTDYQEFRLLDVYTD